MNSYEVFFTMIWNGVVWVRIGSAYRSKECAHSWLGFAKAAHLSGRGKVVRLMVPIISPGKTTERVKQILDRKFNMDVESK